MPTSGASGEEPVDHKAGSGKGTYSGKSILI
jgi:hypothetical protein